MILNGVHEVLSTDIQSGSVPYFTLYFDETTTRQVKKQMDFHVGHWSDLFGRVVVAYCIFALVRDHYFNVNTSF